MNDNINQDYSWNTNQFKIIDKRLEYHEKMSEYLKELRQNGPSYSAPTKPSSSLLISFNRKTKLTGLELHEYLKKNAAPNQLFQRANASRRKKF